MRFQTTYFLVALLLGRLIQMTTSFSPISVASSPPILFRSLYSKKETRESESTMIEYDDFLPNPNPDLTAQDVVNACMSTMLQRQDAGLEVCFNFSSDQCRAALGGSLEKFVQYATNPVFGFLVKCIDWEIVSIGPVIPGTPTRGAMQTILLDAKQEDDGARRFLWTLQQERRPPRQGCWIIHEVIYVKNAFALTL